MLQIYAPKLGKRKSFSSSWMHKVEYYKIWGWESRIGSKIGDMHLFRKWDEKVLYNDAEEGKVWFKRYNE